MGRSEGSKEMVLGFWKDVVKRKMEGGLRHRDLYVLNQALGGKLWWH